MAKKKESVEVKALTRKILELEIEGTSRLVTHNWSIEALCVILSRQMGIPVIKKPKNPQEAYESSLYQLADGSYGFPCMAIKNAMIRAAKLAGLVMVDTRQLFYVFNNGTEERTLSIEHEGNVFTASVKKDLIKVEGEPQMRMDVVRIGNGVSDIRFRAEFLEWKARIRMSYISDKIDSKTLTNLLYRAGMHVGICEGRTELSSLDWGQFTVL